MNRFYRNNLLLKLRFLMQQIKILRQQMYFRSQTYFQIKKALNANRDGSIFLTLLIGSYERLYIIIQMIEIQICSYCRGEIDALEFKEHLSQCSSAKSSPSVQKSENKQFKELKISLNAELIKPYTYIAKFSEILASQIRRIIKQNFQHEIQSYNLILTPEKTQIHLQTTRDLQQSHEMIIKDIIEDELNSYEIISLKIQPNYLQCISHLEDQYVLQSMYSGVLMIAKKDLMLTKVVRFFEDLLSFNKMSKKVTLESEILQFEEDKQKQISETLKSINMFIANADQVSIKTKNLEKKCLVVICGQKQTVQTCKQYMLESLSSEKLETAYKKYRITQEQQKVLQKQKILQKFRQEYGIKYEFKNFSISRTIKLNKHSTVYLLSNPSLLVIPKTAVVIVEQQFLREVKQIQQSVQCLRDYIFYSCEDERGTVEDAVKEFVNFYLEPEGQVAVILPKDKKQQFLEKIIYLMNTVSKNIKLYLLERSDERQAIDALSKCVQKQKRWYVVKEGKKIYYSDKVNQEIQAALVNGIHQLYVTHKELGITKITHKFSDEVGEIIHLKTGLSNFVQELDGQLLTFLDDDAFFVHQNKKKPNQLTLAVFLLNLETQEQRSLITDQKLQMGYENAKSDKSQSKVQYEKDLIEIMIKYPDIDSIDEIWNSIKKLMKKNQITKEFSVEGISNEKIAQIFNWCKLNKINVKLENQKIIVQSYNESNVHNLQKLIEIHQKKLLASPKQFPTYWVVDEKQDLKLYPVNPGTQQFNMVQSKFTVGKIKKLERIQNKILFEKYSIQREFLSQQNGTKVRELMMYHGTRANAPQMIYNDREESFNINYANMGSYGKGIYFAKNSEYSDKYHYNAGGRTRQMFYCMVLAGQSQVYNGKQTHNTSYRDQDKRIRYESVADSTAETIIVVFKNRRAYPLYLISY